MIWVFYLPPPIEMHCLSIVLMVELKDWLLGYAYRGGSREGPKYI